MAVYVTIRRIPLKYNFSQKRLKYTDTSECIIRRNMLFKQEQKAQLILNSKKQKYINTSTKRFDYIKNSIQLIDEVLFSKNKK